MFVRPSWRPQSIEETYELIEDNPWALLINNGEDGPLVTNLPLLLDRHRRVLLGHLARANEHSKALFTSTTPTLAVFHGPYSYVTPTWYPGRDMPGTFYYTAVHCYGQVKAQSEVDLEVTLARLNTRMEKSNPDPWQMNEIPHSEITRRLPAIAGFEIAIERLEAKFKLGQDEPLKDAMAVADRLESSADPWQRQLGQAVRKSNQERTESP
ncbi:MAG: FMN-binding negative transcriptional regulator [Acidobacteriota bacterium]